MFLQALDERNAIDPQAARRLLNVPNCDNTGHIHGVLPAHVGMEVRFTAKLNSTLGLVQEQRGTIVSFLFHAEDQRRYDVCDAGELFRPTFCPSGIWLRLHDIDKSPISEELHSFMERNTTISADASAADANTCVSTDEDAEELMRSLLLYQPV